MSTAVGTHTNTRVRTAVHLTDAIIGTFQNIVASLGLAPDYVQTRWDTIERGLTTWITEGSLDEVSFEFGPQAHPDAVFVVPLSYTVSGDGDVSFVTNQARLARLMAKVESVPPGTSYRMVVSHKGSYASVDGWKDTTAADTSALVSSFAMGNIASGPDASASLNYLTRGG
jgi:hypothetical protein